ncbi:MAG: rRNA maturation RNase YbeY, partial [Thermodesulfobacteriota bacterium]
MLVSDVTEGVQVGAEGQERKAPKDTAKETVAAAMGALDLQASEVSILLTDDEGIRELNEMYRDMDRPTDVLSFPLNDSYMLGDIVISLERVSVQAKDYSVSFDEELTRLLMHGLLHLLGYDHVPGGR